MALTERTSSLQVIERVSAEAGSCNFCDQRTTKVYEVNGRYVGVRFCSACARELRIKLLGA